MKSIKDIKGLAGISLIAALAFSTFSNLDGSLVPKMTKSPSVTQACLNKAVMEAIQSDQTDQIIEKFVNKIDINYYDRYYDQTFLMAAAIKGRASLVNKLLAQDHIELDAKNNDGHNALFLAFCKLKEFSNALFSSTKKLPTKPKEKSFQMDIEQKNYTDIIISLINRGVELNHQICFDFEKKVLDLRIVHLLLQPANFERLDKDNQSHIIDLFTLEYNIRDPQTFDDQDKEYFIITLQYVFGDVEMFIHEHVDQDSDIDKLIIAAAIQYVKAKSTNANIEELDIDPILTKVFEVVFYQSAQAPEFAIESTTDYSKHLSQLSESPISSCCILV